MSDTDEERSPGHERSALLRSKKTRSTWTVMKRSKTKSKIAPPGIDVALTRTRTDFGTMIAYQEGNPDGKDPDKDEPEETEGTQAPNRYTPKTFLGMDQRPLYPAALMFSILWSMAITDAQVRVTEEIFGTGWHTGIFFFTIYSITCYTMAYTALWNPGTLDDDQFREFLEDGKTLPERCKKHWLYKRPVRRFHQYCRWVTNAIGLYNHREYMVMLFGFVTMGSLDAALDFFHVLVRLFQGGILHLGFWLWEMMLILHMAYSAYLAYYVFHLVRMHVGFVLRNELTAEWQTDCFYIIYNDEGEPVAVEDLDDDEFDEHFNHFIYDPTRNKFDRGAFTNLWTFWFRPRKILGETGAF